MEFENFLNSLQETNANLEYFTDFQKCDKNIKAISIKLHSLNYLLGKNDLKIAINDLFKENRACFDILNLLIAIREPTKKLFDETGKLVNLNTYFDNLNFQENVSISQIVAKKIKFVKRRFFCFLKSLQFGYQAKHFNCA